MFSLLLLIRFKRMIDVCNTIEWYCLPKNVRKRSFPFDVRRKKSSIAFEKMATSSDEVCTLVSSIHRDSLRGKG